MQEFSTIYNIPATIYGNDLISEGEIHTNTDIAEYIKQINKNTAVKKYIFSNFSDIKRGDIIHFDSWSTYRNDGKVLWDGKKMILLADNIDDYGHVPRSIKIEEFSHRDYFSKSITHNNLINIDGDNYRIISIEKKIIEETKLYLYTVVHNTMTLKWVILSNDDERRFKKKLEKGIFDTNYSECIETDGDFTFDLFDWSVLGTGCF